MFAVFLPDVLSSAAQRRLPPPSIRSPLLLPSPSLPPPITAAQVAFLLRRVRCHPPDPARIQLPTTARGFRRGGPGGQLCTSRFAGGAAQAHHGRRCGRGSAEVIASLPSVPLPHLCRPFSCCRSSLLGEMSSVVNDGACKQRKSLLVLHALVGQDSCFCF